jgi:hypothetical protein
MISTQKLIDIVTKLLEKARADQVHWLPDEVDEEAYAVLFKESRLYVRYNSEPTELDEVEIGIENGVGETVARLAVQEDDNDPVWNLFFSLYQEAERTVTGSDRILNEIEEELQKEGAIGLS